jgi:hypothetical protein
MLCAYYRSMKVTNVYLTERQRSWLAKTAKKLGISPAELLRRILDQHIERQEKK